MSDSLEAIILGIVQGLTEFLPVSSSGHLELAKWILQDDAMGEQSLLMTVVLHGATALGTILVFYKDVWKILNGLFTTSWNENKDFVLKIIVSMVPAVIAGLFFEEFIEAMFAQRIVLVGSMLILTSILLALTHFARMNEGKITFFKAFIIGLAQALAVVPGISRSGATIATGLLLQNKKFIISASG